MVTKKRKAAPRRRTYVARRAAPRRRANKSGVQYIPGAMATAALVAVNANKIMPLVDAVTNHGKAGFTGSVNRVITTVTTGNSWIQDKAKKLIGPEALVADAVAIAGGYLAGEVVRKYAPGVIKRPLGKIAKKIPKVI